MITHLSEVFKLLAEHPSKKRIVVAYANDAHSIESVYRAVKLGIVEATLVGDEAVIASVCEKEGFDISCFTIVNEPSEIPATKKAVALVREKAADIIMKGLVSTDKYMHAILDKSCGLLPEKAVLSHVTVIENPHYHKLLIVGDVAVIPAPDMSQKQAIIKYLVQVAKSLGNDCPKVALLSASEQVLPKVPSSTEAAILSKMGERGAFGKIEIDGPLGLDVAIDMESVQTKKLKSSVAGDADCILFPNIESGNVFYKANTKLAGAHLGAMLVGATAPSVLSSRGDSVEEKLNSIALAALRANAMQAK